MKSNTALDPSISYRVMWSLFNNSLAYFSIFGFFLIIFELGTGINTTTITFFLTLGILIKVLFTLIRNDLLQLLSVLFPLSFTILGIIASDIGEFMGMELYLIVFFVFTLFNFLTKDMSHSSRGLAQVASYFFIQACKLTAIVVNSFFLHTLLQERVLVRMNIMQENFEISGAILYLIINLCVLALGFFFIKLLLIIRNDELVVLGRKLRLLSSWSLDTRLIDEELLKNDRYLRKDSRTIMFGDIRGFTSFSEKNATETVVTILEDLYGIIEENVEEFGGFKPEFIADEFITFFVDTKDAIDCGLKLNKAVNDYLGTYGLSLGVGIEKGDVLEGIIGSGGSRKYTIFGHSVNVAARLKANAKGGQILISGKVMRSVRNLDCVRVSGITLKGVSKGAVIYSLRGYTDERKTTSKHTLVLNNLKIFHS